MFVFPKGRLVILRLGRSLGGVDWVRTIPSIARELRLRAARSDENSDGQPQKEVGPFMEFASSPFWSITAIYIAPALVCFALWFLHTPANATGLRIAILLDGFVLMRDAMTPLGIWAPSATMQIAFHQDPLVVTGLGMASLMIGFGLLKCFPIWPLR